MAEPLELDRIYDDHAQALFGFVLNLTRHEADTRDLLQELFVKLAQQPNVLQGIQNERAFLIRWAHNLVIDLSRRRGARERNYDRFAEEVASIFPAANDEDERAFRNALDGALCNLPADQRAVVHLKLWEEMTFEQIAAALDIPANTAASRYRYGLDKLREQLRLLYDEIK